RAGWRAPETRARLRPRPRSRNAASTSARARADHPRAAGSRHRRRRRRSCVGVGEPAVPAPRAQLPRHVPAAKADALDARRLLPVERTDVRAVVGVRTRLDHASAWRTTPLGASTGPQEPAGAGLCYAAIGPWFMLLTPSVARRGVVVSGLIPTTAPSSPFKA